jgi:hypothetical protein
VHIPKEGATIAIAPSGVRAPQRAMPAMGGRPANPGEPFGDEAYFWTREHFNQRDVSWVAGCVLVVPDWARGSLSALCTLDPAPARAQSSPEVR